jgi:hypothetical protein
MWEHERGTSPEVRVDEIDVVMEALAGIGTQERFA